MDRTAPASYDTHIELGHKLRRRGDRAGALTAYEAAATLNSRRPGVLADIGGVLRELGQLDEAEVALWRLLCAEPAHFGALVERGHILRRRGDHAGALTAYEAAAASDPQRPGVLVDIGGVLREMGRLDEAEEALRRLLSTEATHFGAHIELGHVLRRRGDRAGALAAYEAAAASDPQRPGVLVDVGGLLREMGRLDEAEGALRRLLSVEPNHFGAHIELGHVLRRRGDRAGALTAYETVATSDPQRPGVLVDIGGVLQEMGRLDEAEGALRRLLSVEPNHFGAHIELGHVLRRRGDCAGALAAYEAAVASDPRHPGVLVDIAAALREIGRLDEAEASLRRLLSTEPTHFGAHIELGHVLRRRGHRADALTAYEAAAASDPQRPGVLVDIAAALRELGRLDEAEASLRRLLSAEPTHFAAHIELGHVLRRRGDLAGALTAYEAAATSDPQRPGVLVDISGILRELGRLDEAEVALRRFIATEPKNSRALVSLAALNLDLFRLVDAESFFKRALELEPNDTDTLVNLGYLERRRGNRHKAISYFRTANSTDPSHVEAAREAFAGMLAQYGSDEDTARKIDFLVHRIEWLLEEDRENFAVHRQHYRDYLQRWQQRQPRNVLNGQVARPDSHARALVVDDRVPKLGRDAGSNAILSHIKSLQRLRYEVTFVPADEFSATGTDVASLERLGIRCCRSPFYGSVEELLRHRLDEFDVVYLHRVSNAAKYGEIAKHYCPKARLIYSVADLYHLRLERQAEEEDFPEVRALATRMRLLEFVAAATADAVITHSAHEAKILRAQLPAANIHVVRWATIPRPTRIPFARRHDVAFIAGYSHTPNLDAARWLISEIMPCVRERNPTVRCLLVGSDMPDDIRRLCDDRYVVARGHVEDLADVFDRVRLTVAPLAYGAGVKGKVIDSMAAGVPCVCTSIAAEGLDLPSALTSWIANDARALANFIIELHNNETANRDCTRAGIDYVSAECSEERIDYLMQQVIGLKRLPRVQQRADHSGVV